MSQTKHIYRFLALLLILLCFSGCDSNEIKEVKPDGLTFGITAEDFQKGYNQFADSLGYAEITKISEPPTFNRNTVEAISDDTSFDLDILWGKIRLIRYYYVADRDSDFKQFVGLVKYLDPASDPEELIKKMRMSEKKTIDQGVFQNETKTITYSLYREYRYYEFYIYPYVTLP